MFSISTILLSSDDFWIRIKAKVEPGSEEEKSENRRNVCKSDPTCRIHDSDPSSVFFRARAVYISFLPFSDCDRINFEAVT